jgi:hypothetical protein
MAALRKSAFFSLAELDEPIRELHDRLKDRPPRKQAGSWRSNYESPARMAPTPALNRPTPVNAWHEPKNRQPKNL